MMEEREVDPDDDTTSVQCMCFIPRLIFAIVINATP